jgi:hypothetical protein
MLSVPDVTRMEGDIPGRRVDGSKPGIEGFFGVLFKEAEEVPSERSLHPDRTKP